jgi:hypothetical protein
MPKRKITAASDVASALIDGAIEDDIMGTIMQSIPGPSREFKEKIENVVKDYVSRQAHLGGILEYTSHTAVVDGASTIVWDWNQTTVSEAVKKDNAHTLMPLILNPSRQGPGVKEIIILKSRFDLSPINEKEISTQSVLPGNPKTWGQLASIAKGPLSIEPDVIVLVKIGGVWYLYIIELKIGAGQAAMNTPKEHVQLMRGKRLIQYYISQFGGEVRPENIKLFFCAWMHGTRKTKVDFRRWEPAEGNSQWDAKVIKGPDEYGKVVGVKASFIDSMMKKLEAYRTRILGQVLKKFTSKTGRYTEEWQKMERKLMNNLRLHPENLSRIGNLPQFAPSNLVSGKGYSGKAQGFGAGVRRAILMGTKSKNVTRYTGARLTAKVRDSRRKARIYYNNFKARYAERLKRAGQSTNMTENAYIRAFLTESPRTGTTPRAKSINMKSAENIATNADKLAHEARALHANHKFKNFVNTKAAFNSLAAKVANSNHPSNLKVGIAHLKTSLNTLRAPAPKQPVLGKRQVRNTPTETSLLFIKGFQNMPNARAQKVLKSLGGARSVMASINGKGPVITNSQLRSAINASVPKSVRASVRTAGVKRSYGSPRSANRLSPIAESAR